MAGRIEILKTYKLYIGGKFPRTESGRYYTPSANGKPLGNICLSSRKDFRNAVVAARSAQGKWQSATAFNKSQIIYRIAEMLEGRRAQFIEELVKMASSESNAEAEVNITIDRLIYFAGWCDKYQQIFSSVNPVSSAHFNFSVYEPQGVVAIVAPEKSALLGLVTSILPVIIGGNTCVVVASKKMPLCAISFGEVLATSDLPGGVVNILTGSEAELRPHIGSHMDVNAINYCLDKMPLELDEACATNMKRLSHYSSKNWSDPSHDNPYEILNFQEVKTTWHPIEQIGGAASKY